MSKIALGLILIFIVLIFLISNNKNQEVLEFNPGCGSVNSLAFSWDGSLLAAETLYFHAPSREMRGKIVLVDVSKMEIRGIIEAKNKSAIDQIMFQKTSGFLLSRSRDGSVRIWEPKKGLLIREIESEGSHGVFSGGKFCLSITKGIAYHYNIDTKIILASIPIDHKWINLDPIFGERIVLFYSKERQMFIWDTRNSKKVFLELEDGFSPSCILGDKEIACFKDDGEMHLLKVDGSGTRHFMGPRLISEVASLGRTNDLLVRTLGGLYRVEKGRYRVIYENNWNMITAMASSPNGKVVACGTRSGRIRIIYLSD